MKKITKIILISFTSLFLLYFISIYINYNRVIKGKGPLLSYHTLSVSNLDVKLPNNNNFIPFEHKDYSVYSVVGYKIIKCDDCTKSVYIMPLGIGKYPSEFYSCVGIDYPKNSNDLSFNEGYLETISSTLVMEGNFNEPEEDVLDLNNTAGCYEKKIENKDQTLTVTRTCNLSQMSDEDINRVYGQTRDKLKLTKKEISKLFKSEDSDMLCK